jgi:hypothetical protein
MKGSQNMEEQLKEDPNRKQMKGSYNKEHK